MKFPYSMLLDFVQTNLTAAEVGDLLTMAGFELEGIEEAEGESVLDIKVVSNRGDGLSVHGLAREVLAKDPAATPTELYALAAARFPAPDEGDEAVRQITSVDVQTEDCTRYACRVFEEVQNGSSPEWMQKRLRLAGMRPISLLVDLTNYVLLELGQPLHAFDLDKLAGSRIVVRKAQAGERLVTLNGAEHELRPDQMMICDAEKPVAAAGIMGGEATEVGPQTRRMLLESAHFVNTSVRRTRKQLGLSTEASYRFERSVDPEGVVAAVNRFKMLLDEVGGARPVPGVIDVYPNPPQPVRLPVRLSRAVRLLGMPVSADEARSYLTRLGFEVSGDGEPFQVAAPTWRPDIQREDDLVEEIGRIHGFDRIPEAFPTGVTTLGGVFGTEREADRIREALSRTGFVQTISHSLRDAHPLDDPGLNRIGPRNPHSPEAALLRNSLLPSLADAARRNGGRDVHLFEVGRVFAMIEDRPQEQRMVALLSSGELYPPNRAKEPMPQSDFFSLKGALEEAIRAIGGQLEFFDPADVAPTRTDPRLHPTRQALVSAAGNPAGIIGQIHPDVAEEVGIAPGTVLAEVSLDALHRAPAPHEGSATATAYASAQAHGYRPISRNPAVRRDIAVVVEKSLPYARLEEAVRGAAGDVLERIWLFDVYEGAGIPEGKHSLAIALQLRKFGENFTDEEANQVRERIVAELESLGATPRV
jgi:phenylalanyl-tRNA synthetase beta chain